MKTLFLILLFLLGCKKDSDSGVRVAITVDDIPASGIETEGVSREQILSGVLEAFRKNSVPRAFGFMNGLVLENQAARYEIMKKWKAEGHLIGNHTYSHFDYGKTSFDDFRKDLERNETFLLDFSTDISEVKTFRFPFLQEGETQEKRYAIREYFQKRGYRNAQVTIDFHDWAFLEPYARCKKAKDSGGVWKIRELYLEHAKKSFEFSISASKVIWGNRDIPHILLIHLNGPTSEWIGDVLEGFRKQGVTFIDPIEAIKDKLYDEDTSFWGTVGKSFIHQALESRKIPGQIQEEVPWDALNKLCN